MIFTRAELLGAFRLGLAAWGAFAVASGLGIDHAFWASMPVWVVAQPWRGVVFERALWRIVGTLIGGALGIALLQLSPAPWVTAVAMSVCIAAGAAAIHLAHGVRTYIPMMIAITIAVVVMPGLLHPEGGIALALDRLACTLIGGVAVALIVGLFTPRAGRHAFRDEVSAFAADLRAQAIARIDSGTDTVGALLRRAAELEARARLIGAGSARGYRLMRGTDRVLAAALMLLEAAGAAHALAAEVPGLRERALSVLRGQAGAEHGALARLARADAALQAACAALQAGRDQPLAEDAPRLRTRRNPGRALLGAGFALSVSLIGTLSVVATGQLWAELTAFSVVIFVLVIGSLPLPQAMAPKVAVGVTCGALAGMLYRIGVQPWVEGWPGLVLTLAPFIAVGALARVHRRTAIYGLDANMCFMLASQAGAAAVPARAAVIDTLAMIAGTVTVISLFLMLRRPGRHLIAPAAQKLWREIALLAEGQPRGADRWAEVAGRQILNLAVELEKAREQVPPELLALVAAGHAVIELREDEGGGWRAALRARDPVALRAALPAAGNAPRREALRLLALSLERLPGA